MCREVPWQSRIEVSSVPPKLEGLWFMINSGGHTPQENPWSVTTPPGELAWNLDTLALCTLLATVQDKSNTRLPCYVCIQPFICLPVAVASLGWWAGLHVQVPGAPWLAIRVKWKGCPRSVLFNWSNSGITSLHPGQSGIPWKCPSPIGRFLSFLLQVPLWSIPHATACDTGPVMMLKRCLS